MDPTPAQIGNACELLRAAGWRLQSPRALKLLTIAQLSDLLAIGETRARWLANQLPGTVRFPGGSGGDIRVREADVAEYLAAHPKRIHWNNKKP